MLEMVVRTEDGFVDKSVRATSTVEMGAALGPTAGTVRYGVSGESIEDMDAC